MAAKRRDGETGGSRGGAVVRAEGVEGGSQSAQVHKPQSASGIAEHLGTGNRTQTPVNDCPLPTSLVENWSKLTPELRAAIAMIAASQGAAPRQPSPPSAK